MPTRSPTLDDLRRFAVTRSLFPPTTLPRAIKRLGFVQADPIRAPARAQDLILRHRVKGYRAGDLERRFESLEIEEDFFVTYGFVTRPMQALMHPRTGRHAPAGHLPAGATQRKRERQLLDFVAAQGEVHPRIVQEHFAHGTVQNYWGGSSHATTHMLDALHYRGLLRIARREKGIRIYAAQQHDSEPLTGAERRVRLDALVDLAVNLYAPLPATSLSFYVRKLRYAAPQWQSEIADTLRRARERLASAQVQGIEWFWPNEESPHGAPTPEAVRFLAPFDPVVHDRRRFELFWGWIYRFEAYTPPAKRQRGYYALPLLWRDRVIGWCNLAVTDGELTSEFGYITGHPPRERAFRRELTAELNRVHTFLGL